MVASSRSITTKTGVTLLADDTNPRRFFVLPNGLAPAVDATGNPRFCLIFYQADFPDRGARLVTAVAPTYPKIDPEDVTDLGGPETEVVGIPFESGEAHIVWAVDISTPAAVPAVLDSVIYVEMSFTQSQGAALRQLVRGDVESCRLSARLAYAQTTATLPAIALVNLRRASIWLSGQVGGDALTGMKLRTLVAGLPEAALRLDAQGDFAALSRADMLWRASPVLAPNLARVIAEQTGDGLVFDDKVFRLRPQVEVGDVELRLELARPWPWIGVWEGEWSLSGFHAEIEAAGELTKYFPEVLHLAPVTTIPVLVENLLTLTVETIRRVHVTLKHKRLGSLEEEVFNACFEPESGPVARHEIPHIAYTPFRYQYKAQLALAPETPQGLEQAVPPDPQWQVSDQPVVRVGLDHMPYAVLFATAHTGLFDLVGRVDVEFSEVGARLPIVLARAELSGEHPSRWLLVRSLASTTREIRWRPVFYKDVGGTSPPVYGTWRTETRPWAALDPWDALPREPKRIHVTVRKGDTPEIHLLTVQLRSGTSTAAHPEPGVSWSFTGDETRTLMLWPETIVDVGFVYRVSVSLSGGKELLVDWQVGQGDSVEVNAENDFYFTRQIQVTMKGPWSAQHSPDPSSLKGEIIYADVYLSLPEVADTQSKSFTFDADNQGQAFNWTVRGPRGAERYTYQVQVLSLNGQLHQFGPYQSDREKLAIEVIRTFVSDVEPPKFAVRETPA